MILIDSLYINSSGGLRLLLYLIDALNKSQVKFFLLADSRCSNVFDNCESVQYMKASLRSRRDFYEQHRHDFRSVLCFGNIPAPVRMPCLVYTYFHNINLLTLTEANSVKEKMLMWSKRQIFRHYKNNTDFWLVQTTNTAKELVAHLHERQQRVKLMPFYELPQELNILAKKEHGEDYAFISDYYGRAKGHDELLEAWFILHQRGIDKKLHLTVNEKNTEFLGRVVEMQSKGVNIVNHGFLPFEEVYALYEKSKAIVYPSHNESLGLGVVEGISAGCDVVAADLPYIHAICTPSQVFNPFSALSIADAVEKYEMGSDIKKSSLKISNMIKEMVSLLRKE